MRPELRLRLGGSESDVTNEARTTIEQKMWHVHEDLRRGLRAPERAELQVHEIERNRILRTTFQQKMRHGHEDLRRGWRTPERAE